MPKNKSPKAHTYDSREPDFFIAPALRAAVVIVIETGDGLTPSRTTEAGDTEQVVFAGSPAQVGVTVAANPFAGTIFKEYVAFCPAMTDWVIGVAEIAKLPGGGVCVPTVTAIGAEVTPLRLLSPGNWTLSWCAPSARTKESVAASAG